jgi:ketosteroid isomerase-like protein
VIDAATRERIQAGYDAFFRRDVDGAVAFMAPEVVAVDAAEMPDTGIFRGRDKLAARLAGFLEMFDELELRDLCIDEVGDRALVRLNVHARAGMTGVPVEMVIVHLLLVEDGLVTEMRVYFDEDEARAFAESR